MVCSRRVGAGLATVTLAGVAAVLLVACEQVDPEPDPVGSGTPTPGTVAPGGEAFDFCGIIDLDEATEVAEDLGVLQRLGAEGRPVVVSSRRVANAGTDVESELCRYGTELGQLGFDLQAYPARGRRDVPGGAEAREELGEGAYFRDGQDGWFTLTVPAGDAYLQFTGIVSQSVDAADAEDGLARLLLPGAERVPSGAGLAGLAGGEQCDQLTEPVARALGAPPEFSRYTEVDTSFACEFTTSGGRMASVGLHRGVADDWQVDPDLGWRALDGLDDAWQDNSGVILAFVGDDVVRVHMLGIDDGDGPVDEDLTAEVVPVLTG